MRRPSVVDHGPAVESSSSHYAIKQAAPLSFAQLPIWIIDRTAPGTAAYNVPVGYRLLGALNCAALENSINAIIRRHAVLRATFTMVDGEPRQVIHSDCEVTIRNRDLAMLAPESQRKRLHELASEEARTSFDIQHLPLIRVLLIKLGNSEHVLVVNFHHIVIDGVSLAVFLDELDSFYSFFIGASSSHPAELQVQYADVAAAERADATKRGYARELGFWRQELDGAPAALDLPADFPRPPVQSFAGANVLFQIPRSLISELETLGARYGCTLFATFVAAYQILLHRYSRQMEVVVGTPLAGRNPLTRAMIGNFINMIPLRGDLSGNPAFGSFLQRTNKRIIRAFSKGTVPFLSVAETVPFNRDASRNPIFQTMIELLPAVRSKIGDLRVERFYFDTGAAQFDLSFHAWEEAEGFDCRFEYRTDLFRHDTVQRMVENFLCLLESVAANPDRLIDEVPIISQSQREQILFDWNSTSRAYPRERCVHQLIATVAEASPDRVAIECEAANLTYAQLDRRSSQLAHCLIQRGVGLGDRVGVYLGRSVNLPVALLGILKAGAAYVPLDPSFPTDRLSYMVSDSGLRTIVTERSLRNSLPGDQTHLTAVDIVGADVRSADSTAPLITVRPTDLAYTIYTSGSSGRPKGVMIEHRSLVNCLCAMQDEPGFGPSDILVAVTTISFDIAALEIFLPLVSGGRLVLATRSQATDANLLTDLLERSRATMLQATPATWRLLLGTSWKPGPDFKMLCGGEALSRELAECLLNRGGRLFNMYGPTETTIWSSVVAVGLSPGSVPIGPPIANTQFSVVDEMLNPVPIGVPGELLIGGDGLARGYWNQPELTDGRFIIGQFGSQKIRLYRTGDVVRWRPDGCLEFLGRRDFQVKVRGFRIELEEIENVLTSHPAVKEAAVAVWSSSDDDARLVAHYIPVAGRNLQEGELRNHLRKALPEYMCPSFFIEHTAFPLTPNGKIDRKTLPAPDLRVGQTSRLGGDVPQTALEASLLSIWRETLGRPIRPDDNFFDVGGHSLLAARMFLLIEERLGIRIPLSTLFQHPTVRALADNIDVASGRAVWRPLVPIQPEGSRPPLFLVHGAEGNVILYRGLAERLGGERPVYGLQAPGLDGSETRDLTVEELAAFYCNEVRSVQPHGPYYIGGYCLGGTIAFEMARQFRTANEPVAFVGLLESYNIKSRPPASSSLRLFHVIQGLCFQVGNFIASSGNVRYLVEKLRTELSRLRVQIDALSRTSMGKLRGSYQVNYGHLRVKEQNHSAQDAYNPGLYDGVVTLFRSTVPFRGFADPEYGWGKLAKGGVRIVEVAQYPHGSLNEPFVRKLARAIRDEFDGIYVEIADDRYPKHGVGKESQISNENALM